MSHGWIKALLIANLVLSGLVVMWRGGEGSVRRYTVTDALFGVLECALMVWGVAVL